MATAPGQDILLDTSAGSAVPNVQASVLLYPVAAQALQQNVALPSILRMNSHPRFNCHGLTFASRRTAVLNDREINQILAEDDYQVVAVADVLPGDVALYFSPIGTIDHSAVVASIPAPPLYIPFVFSKWGAHGPEVYHPANQGPGYAVGDIRYYRVRP
jgi:hypothetical protein